jgi:hypothetical protein
MKPQKTAVQSGSGRQKIGPQELLKHSSHPSWKVGKYWDNSGTSNPLLQKVQSERVLPLNRFSNKNNLAWPLNSFDSNLNGLRKNFNSNSESKVGWENKNYRCSTINYQNRDYNFITHTVATRPTSTTTSRQKGFGEYVDATRPFKKEVFAEYQHVYKNNPNVFRRQTGEFTKHQDNCVRLSGFGPFNRPF